MNTADDDNREDAWQLRVISRCDAVLNALSEVLRTLKKGRKGVRNEPVSLRLFQESLGHATSATELLERF